MCVTDSSVQSVYVTIEGQYRSRKVSRIVTEGVAYVRTFGLLPLLWLLQGERKSNGEEGGDEKLMCETF